LSLSLLNISKIMSEPIREKFILIFFFTKFIIKNNYIVIIISKDKRNMFLNQG